jgi:hypothetical protein
MINRFRLAAILLCLRYVGPPIVVYFLISSFFKDDQEKVIIAAAVGGGLVLSAPIQWLIAQRTRCPLCLTPVLSEKSCSKHRQAKTFLGSYRLRVALSVMFKGSFRCPYCNEPSVLEIRTRRH